MRLNRASRGASALAFVLACVVSCNQGRPVSPNPPVVVDQDQCAAACDNLKALGCQEGNPIDMKHSCHVASDCKDIDGNVDPKQSCAANGECMVTCAQFCIDTEDAGVWLDPGCVRSIRSCDQVESCPMAMPKQPVNTCEGPACALSR